MTTLEDSGRRQVQTHGKYCNLLKSVTLGFYNSLTAVARCSSERFCCGLFQVFINVLLKNISIFFLAVSSPYKQVPLAVMRQLPKAKGIPKRRQKLFFKRQWFCGNYREAFISIIAMVFNCSWAMFSNGCLRLFINSKSTIMSMRLACIQPFLSGLLTVAFQCLWNLTMDAVLQGIFINGVAAVIFKNS